MTDRVLVWSYPDNYVILNSTNQRNNFYSAFSWINLNHKKAQTRDWSHLFRFVMLNSCKCNEKFESVYFIMAQYTFWVMGFLSVVRIRRVRDNLSLTKVIEVDRTYTKCSIYVNLLKQPELWSPNPIKQMKFTSCEYYPMKSKSHRPEGDTATLMRLRLVLDAELFVCRTQYKWAKTKSWVNFH